MSVHKPLLGRRLLVAGFACAWLASGLSATAPLGLGLAPTPADAAAPADLLPDLAMSYPTQLRLERTSSGARRLRLTTTIVNIGDGPFETASSRLAGKATMGVSQRIYNTAGTYRVVETEARARYSGDGHDHWHVLDIARYEIHPLQSNGKALRRDAKVGFCFFDTNAYNLDLARAPQSPRYGAAGCGKRSSLFVRNGISVGWGDRYRWSISRQWIDVTNLPAGEYYLKLTVDPLFQFQEVRHRNDCNWTRIRIPMSGTTVTVLGRAYNCVLPGQEG